MTETVVFEETGVERNVVAYCKVCKATQDDFPNVIVSPAGVAHHTDGHDHTACGHDATGTEWWWQT